MVDGRASVHIRLWQDVTVDVQSDLTGLVSQSGLHHVGRCAYAEQQAGMGMA